MGTKDQIHSLLRNEGMSPKEISYDDVLDTYRVEIDVEGTEDRFIKPYSGTGESEVESLDIEELEEAKDRLQFSEIPNGKVFVEDRMAGFRFRIRVV
jgi:hypothetical protein